MYKPKYYEIKPGAKDIGDAIEHLPFWVANAMKYLYRCDGKDSAESNLEKAKECIIREIARRTKGSEGDVSGVRQEGAYSVDWNQLLSENSSPASPIRPEVGKSVSYLSPCGGGNASEAPRFFSITQDDDYKVRQEWDARFG